MSSAEETYRRTTPRSQELHERAVAVMPGGTTRTTTYFPPYPLYIERGDGVVELVSAIPLSILWGTSYKHGVGDHVIGNHPPCSRSAAKPESVANSWYETRHSK